MHRPMHKTEIETPALIIDLDKMEANLQQMADFFASQTANLRPHFKTHKTPIIAHKQIAAGAKGITCAKLSEAEVLVHHGINDVLIANQVVDPVKIARLVDLAQHSDLIVAVDHPDNVAALSAEASGKRRPLNLIIEVDVGMTRAGTRSLDETLRLAKQITSSPGLRFRGLMGYEGHAVFTTDRTAREEATRTANQLLVEHAEMLRANGIEVEIVSAGGSGTYDLAGSYPGITEVEAGSYVFMDATYRGVGLPFECALTVLSTVVSLPSPDRAVCDAGIKAMTNEFGLPIVKDVDGIKVKGLSEEHCSLDLVNPSRPLKLGEKVEFIPSHCCTTINLHDRFYALRGDRVEAVWEIAGRGKSQ